MLKTWIAASAMLAFVGASNMGASAQSPAPAAAAIAPTAAPPFVDAARFIESASAYSATLSPDGNLIAYIERTSDGERLVVMDVAAQRSVVVQSVPQNVGALDWVSWKGNDRLIFGVRAQRSVSFGAPTGSHLGAINIPYDVYRVMAMDRNGAGLVQMFQGQLRSLAHGFGSNFLLDDLPNDPGHVLIVAQDNNGAGVWRGDIVTGHVENVQPGSLAAHGYMTDINGALVMRLDDLDDASGYRIYRRAPDARDWTFVLEARRAETATNSPDFSVLGPGPGPGQVYVLARTGGSNLSALYLYNTATGELGQPLQQGNVVDASTPWVSRRTRQVLATCQFEQRMACTAADPTMRRNLAAIDAFFDHQATIRLVDTSDDAHKWLLRVEGPNEPGGYYFYDVVTHNVQVVAAIFPNLDPDALSPTNVVTYQSRDGAPLWAYVTARPGIAGPRPMVVMPHGGPEARDFYGYDPYAQFLASRGYVVVQPNFRGGLGFGRAFADAGRRQWGLRMQDDITDAVHHMIDAGLADPHRICIVGASYGGYAALEGVASTPDLYKCAIAIAGPSDLREMLHDEGQGGHGTTHYQYWLHSIGDPNADRAALIAASPRLQAARITAPVLLIHGDVDGVVPFHQSEMMRDALNAAGRPTRLVTLQGEGHMWGGWSNDNRLLLMKESEAFLAQQIGNTSAAVTPPAPH